MGHFPGETTCWATKQVFKKLSLSPGRCGSVGWVWFEPLVCEFDSRSGYMPGLRVQSAVGVRTKGSLSSVSPLCLPFPLSKINKQTTTTTKTCPGPWVRETNLSLTWGLLAGRLHNKSLFFSQKLVPQCGLLGALGSEILLGDRRSV